MAVGYRGSGAVRESVVRYPFGDVASGLRPQVGDVAILAVYGSHSLASDSNGETWNYVGTQNTTSLYWTRVSVAHTSQKEVNISSGYGHISVYTGVRASGDPYSQIVGSAPAGSDSTTTLGGLSGYDETNAFLVGIVGRTGDIESGDTVAFSGISGGTNTKISPNTFGNMGSPFVAYINGTSGTSPASVFFSHGANRNSRGAFLFDLTDASPTSVVSTTVATSWTTYGTPPATSIVGTTTTYAQNPTVTVNYPSGTGNNDIVFLVVNGAAIVSGAWGFSDSGWNFGDSYNATHDLTFYWKRVTGSPTSVTVTFPAYTEANVNMVTVRNVDPDVTSPWLDKTVNYRTGSGSSNTVSMSVSDTDQRNFLLLGGRGMGSVSGDTATWNNVTGGSADTRKLSTSSYGSLVASLITGDSLTDPVSATHDWFASGIGNNTPGVSYLLNLAVLVLEEPTNFVELYVDTAWSVGETVPTTKSTAWNVSTVVSTTKSAGTWGVRTSVQTTKSTAWTSWQSTPAERWIVRWNTRSAVTKATATSWSVASRVTTSKSTTWSTKASVTPATKSTAWNTRAQVVVSKAISWKVFTPVSATKSVAWSVNQAANAGQVTMLDSSPAIVGNNVSGATNVTTASFNAESGSFLLAYVESAATTPTTQSHSVTDSSGMTWTQFAINQPESPRGGGALSVWYAAVPTNRTITVNASRDKGDLGFVLKVYALANVDSSDPFGATKNDVVFGTPSSSNIVTINLTPVATNSIVFFGATVNTENQADPQITTSLANYESWRGSSGEGTVGYQTVYSAPSNISVTLDGGSITNTYSPWNYIALELTPVPVYVPVSKTVSTSWATRQAVVASKSTSWGTHAVVSKTVSTSWTVEMAKVMLTKATSWNTRAVAKATTAVSWDTYTSVSKKTQSTAWTVFRAAMATKSTTWSVLQTVIERLSTSWRVLPQPWDGSTPDAVVRVSALYSEVVLGDTIDTVRVGGTQQTVAAPILEEAL